MTRKAGMATPHFHRSYSSNNPDKPKEGAYVPPRDEHFLPIGRKIELMISFANDAIDRMPRNHKPVIGKILESFMWDL